MSKSLTLFAAVIAAVALAGCAANLHQSAGQGDVVALKQKLSAGANINESAWWGTPLAYASWYCKPEAASYLLEKGADLEVSRSFANGYRPLHLAIYGNCIEVVRLLVEAGADVNAKPDSAHGSPLLIAVSENRDQVAKYLIARGADLEEAITLSRSAVDSAKVTPILEGYRQEAIVEAARKAAQERAEKEQARIREIENADLVELLKMRPETGSQVEALTQALIRAKNTQLPPYIARSSVDERINLLSTVELRISDAQTLMARLNAMAEDAVRQGQSAAALREEAGKVQTYSGLLAAIRSMLLQS